MDSMVHWRRYLFIAIIFSSFQATVVSADDAQTGNLSRFAADGAALNRAASSVSVKPGTDVVVLNDEESFVFDADGNPLTSSLLDYGTPMATEMPEIVTAHTITPSPLNPLGAKGIGESGTIGSTPAVQNAIIDAVSHLGVRHIDMPLTSDRVWRAIRNASEAKG